MAKAVGKDFADRSWALNNQSLLTKNKKKISNKERLTCFIIGLAVGWLLGCLTSLI